MVPGFRTHVSFPAKMSSQKFVAYMTGECLIWNVFLVFIGVYLGTTWRQVVSESRYLIIGVVAASLMTSIVLLIRRKRRISRPVSLG